MCPPGGNRKQFLLGHEHSSRSQIPQMSDPDVPFVRVRLEVSPYDLACAPPNVIPGSALPPVALLIVAVERVDWKRPQ